MTKTHPENKAAGFSSPTQWAPGAPDVLEQTLRCLRNLSSALHSTLEVESILDHVIRESRIIVGAEKTVIAVCYSDGISLVRCLDNGAQLPAPEHPGAGPVIPGRVVLEAGAYLTNDALHDPCIDPERAAANGVSSVVSVPLVDADGTLIGNLEVQNKRDPAGFSNFDLEQLATVAQIASQSITNAKAYQKIAQNSALLEGRVAERTAQLQEANEELDSFAYSISHELRAPLRAIQSYAELLQENQTKANDPEHGQFLERIVGAARHMDQLIQDILNYSRVWRQDMLLHTVDLDQVVRDAVEQIRGDAGEAGAFQLEIAGGLPSVRGDQGVLVQVVLNLLSNAIKYVAKGTTPVLRIWAETADGTARLVLQDNGIGIAPDDQERIFKVFERLHGMETYPGNGIGLALARRALTRLGGRIGVQSRLGEGSRFWIELPLNGGQVSR
jgi:signal transduction histidine kinase